MHLLFFCIYGTDGAALKNKITQVSGKDKWFAYFWQEGQLGY